MRTASTNLKRGQTAHSPSTSNTISDTDTTGDGTRTITTTVQAITDGTHRATIGDGMTHGTTEDTGADGMIHGTTEASGEADGTIPDIIRTMVGTIHTGATTITTMVRDIILIIIRMCGTDRDIRQARTDSSPAHPHSEVA